MEIFNLLIVCIRCLGLRNTIENTTNFSSIWNALAQSCFHQQNVLRMFRFGDYMLEYLYPLKNSTMRSVVYAMALCDQNLTEESMKWALDIHKQTCNEDSSIWLLKRNEEDLALFAGDSTDETLRAALCGHIITPTSKNYLTMALTLAIFRSMFKKF